MMVHWYSATNDVCINDVNTSVSPVTADTDATLVMYTNPPDCLATEGDTNFDAGRDIAGAFGSIADDAASLFGDASLTADEIGLAPGRLGGTTVDNTTTAAANRTDVILCAQRNHNHCSCINLGRDNLPMGQMTAELLAAVCVQEDRDTFELAMISGGHRLCARHGPRELPRIGTALSHLPHRERILVKGGDLKIRVCIFNI